MDWIIHNASVLLTICAGIFSAGVLGIILLISFSRKQDAVKVFDRINDRLMEHKDAFFRYDKIAGFLQEHGAKYHFPFLAEPLRYLFSCVVFGAVGLVLGNLINMPAGLGAMVIGTALPYFLITGANKQDKELILEDIKILYNVLYNQLRAGIFVSDALMECSSGQSDKQMIKNKRLLTELQQLSRDIFLKSNVSEALARFERQFSDIYITSLCVVINQAMESGMAAEALKDITEQLKEVEKNLLYIKKERKQIRNLFFELAMLLGMVITMFMFIMPEIVKMANSM